MRKLSALPYFFVLLAFFFCFEGFGQVNLPVTTTTLSRLSLPTGFTHSGLGTDYAGPKLKFDTQGDNLVLNFNTLPGTLSFEVGINGNSNTPIPSDAIFSVYESVNGVSYSIVSSYSSISSGIMTITGLNSNSRYIKWEYSIKPSGSNVSLHNINLLEGEMPCEEEPTSQATNITYTDNSSTSLDVDWSAGAGGDEYILVAREGSAVSFTPTDGTDYSGDTGGGNYASATDQGSGNKVVYTGSTTSATVTGLTTGNSYYFQVFAVCTGDSHNYLTSTGTGNLGTLEYIVPASIPDNGCSSSNYLESSLEYSGGSPIGDLNVFVAITHPWRGDLRIQLESPGGTIVHLIETSIGGNLDNLEVIFDDEAGTGVFGDDHIIDGTEDVIITSPGDPLSDFDGEDPNGFWTLRICDAAGGDIGSLNDWSLDITIAAINPEPTNHPTNFECFTYGSDEIDLIWDGATGAQLPDGYLIRWSDISYASISNPVDSTPVPNGSNAQNVPYGDETLEVTGLNQNTDYFFKIFPYTNAGTDIDYKIDGVISQTSCVTDIGPCGFENFDNAELTTSYANNSYVGNNGVTWEYIESRDENGDDNNSGIDGNAIMLRQISDNSKITSSNVSGGIADFSVKLYKGFTGEGNRQVELFVNGVSQGTSTPFDDFDEHVFTVTGINIDGDIVIEIRNITSKQVIIDDIEWTCYSGCTPNQTISGFYPIEGPAETIVTIIGTGFTGATDVQFGGISSTDFTVEHDTLITAEVPLNGLTGKVSVTVAGCDRQSQDDFTILDENNQCGIGGSGPAYASDLFISEVYDATSGSLSYIEVFNGTNATVDLSPYEIQVVTGPSLEYSMSGNLSSGDTYILRIGTGTICSGVTPDNDLPSAPGFNGDDIINLLKNGSILDHVPNPNIGKGFDQARKDDVSGPTTTYNSSEWIISNTENCDDLSIAPYIPGSNQITINDHPQDVDCDTLTFTVDASTSVSPNFVPSTYTWRCIAPGDDTWSLVSALNGSNGLTVTGSNTPTITITGNTSILTDYQFYVDMGAGGDDECRRYSNAAQYTFDTKALYRTVASGNWSDDSIWEMSDTEGSGYISVCQYPIDRTSDKIIIHNGHNINLDVEIAVDWIDICTTCTLELAYNTKLTLLDGNAAGADLIVNGTLIDNGNQANGIEFLDDLSTWELGSQGTIIKTSSSYATRYRNAYHTGIASIPETATWIYRYTNTGILSFASSTDSITMHYPNLILENAIAGTFSSNINGTNVFLSTFTMAGTQPIVIKGDFDIGGNGTGNINFSNIITDTNPTFIGGQLSVRSGSTLRNTGTNAPAPGTGFEVQGDMDIEGTLDLSAGTGSNQGILKLSGDDMIGIGANTIEVNHLIVDKNPGFAIYADMSVDVKSELSLTSGIFELAELTNTIILPQGVVVNGGSNASHIDGFVSKSGSEDFLFPVGDEGYYQPIGVETMSEASTFRARYVADVHPEVGPYYDGNAGAYGILEELGHCDYWTLNRIAGSASANVRLTYGNTPCNDIQDATYLNMAKWDGSSWEYPVIGVNQLTPGEIFSTNPFPNFSDFVLTSAGPDNLNILPIQLTSFTAKPENQKVKTAWITESETNNDYFIVERSADARFFEEIGKVNGAGTSHHTNHYTFTDQKPLPGVSYYRLKQTDFDGHYSYSDIKAVSFTETDGFSLDLTYRDGNDLNLVYNSISPYILVEIFDVLGKRVFTEVAENYGGRSVLNPNLGRGAYVVRISAGEKWDSGKIVW